MHQPFRPHTKISRHWQMIWDKTPKCPGAVSDPNNSKHKFERWQKRPKAAWRLYWRTHS